MMIHLLAVSTALLVQGAPPAPTSAESIERTAQPDETHAGATGTTARASNSGLVVYGIADLTGQHRLDALAHDITSGDAAEETRIVALERYVELIEDGDVAARAEDIRSTVEELVQPPLVEGAQRVALVDDSNLVVVGTPTQQAWVRDFLSAARTFDGLVDVQARILSGPAKVLSGLVGNRTGEVLDDAEVARILKAVESLDGVELVSAPRITTFPMAPAQLCVLDQTAYIRDFEIQVLPDQAREIADPVIEVLQTGLTFDVRAVPLAERRLALRCALDHTTAERPFREQTLRVGASDTEVTVQLPEVRSMKASGRFDLEPGRTIVMSSMESALGGSGDAVLVLLKASVVPAETADGLDPRAAAPSEKRR